MSNLMTKTMSLVVDLSLQSITPSFRRALYRVPHTISIGGRIFYWSKTSNLMTLFPILRH